MKSVRISDEAYKKIIKRSKKDKRTITSTIDIMIDESIANAAMANKAAAFNTSPYSPVDWGSEPTVHYDNSGHAAIIGDSTKEMTVDEIAQMNQRIRNKAPNWEMSEDE